MTDPYPLSDRHPLIRDRGRGPELVGSRITVFDLLPDLLDPAQSEAEILSWYPSLTREQVSAARAYALEYAERLLPEQRAWESRPEPRNPPEVEAAFERGRRRIEAFRAWRAAGGELGPTREDTRAWFEAWLDGRAGAAARREDSAAVAAGA